MALTVVNNGEAANLLGLTPATAPTNINQEDLCDRLFNSITENINNCKYYDLDSFSIDKANEPNGDSLYMMHVNVRSLYKNFDSLHAFLVSLPFTPHLISLSESRIHDQPLMNINLAGYKFLNVSPTVSKAGGVAVYIHESIDCQKQPHQFQLPSAETMWLTLKTPFSLPITVGIIYRHPNSSTLINFIDELSLCLETLNTKNTTFYLLGDININILETPQSSGVYRYLNSLLSNLCIPLITKPTRVNNNSATAIDHILTNDTDHVINPGVIPTDEISDHYVIFCEIKKLNSFKKSKLTRKYFRDKSKLNILNFCDNLKIILDEHFAEKPLLSKTNFNNLFDDFTRIISSTIDKHAPLKPFSRKQRKLMAKPWLTKGILVSIKKKRSMFKSHLLKGNTSQKIFFKKYSNKLTKVKNHAKRNYFDSELLKYQKDSKKTWETLRLLLPTSKKHAQKSVSYDSQTHCNLAEKSEQFNNFFCTIGNKLANSMSKDTSNKYKTFLKQRISSSIFLEPPSLNEVINCIHSLNVNKAVGHDNIPAYFVKIAYLELSPYLCTFLEFSFSQGIFPKSCTIAKTIPIHKTGDKKEPSNYRPISILTCFSKIFEKLIHKRFINFFNKHHVLTPKQFGFQKKLSTSYAIMDLITNTFDNINSKLFTGILFLELAKAFDTVNHKILLDKLNHYGIRGQSNNLIESFLQKSQYVFFNDTKSEILPNNIGVPQGSILGPLLFLIYINDVPNAVNGSVTLFADDTCLMVQKSTLPDLQISLNFESSRLYNWCRANKLTVNPSKCNVLLVPPQLRADTPDLTIQIADSIINTSNNVKYLGIHIDSKLTFQYHIKSIENKLSKAVGILSKLKSALTQNSLLKIYYALVHPHLLYGITIWGSTYSSYIDKIYRLQNKAVKLIGGGKFREKATPYYGKLKILKIQDLYNIEIAKFVYDFFHNNVPCSFSTYFNQTCKLSRRSTRLSSDVTHVRIPLYKTNRLQRNIKFQGATIWNHIPPHIKKLSRNNFVKKLQDHLLQKYF